MSICFEQNGGYIGLISHKKLTLSVLRSFHKYTPTKQQSLSYVFICNVLLLKRIFFCWYLYFGQYSLLFVCLVDY